MGKRKWWVLASLTWMALIFFFTQLPYFTGEKTSEVIQKVVIEQKEIRTPSNDDRTEVNVNGLNLMVRKATHVMVFGILALFLYKAFEGSKYSYILSWLVTFVYAVTDEWHQSFMPGRVASFIDVLFDSFGAFVALVLVFTFHRKRVDETKY